MTKHKAQEFFRKLYQKRWVRFIVYSLMVLGVPVAGFYAHFIETKKTRVSKIKVPIKNLPPAFHGTKIVQISDIHYGPTNNSSAYLLRCVDMIHDLKPDLVVMTGDFMQWDVKYAAPLANLLGKIQAPFGIFASLGNHDYGVCHPGKPADDDIDHITVISEFSKRGIRVLHNEHHLLEKGGARLGLVGLGDFWTEHFLPEKGFWSFKDKSHPIILLSHNPDSLEELTDYPFDLMLSGHVHGGQISFPFIGPLTVPVKNRHHRRGLHRIGHRWLYANRGLGFIFKARFLSPPEITCLELVPIA